jgi:YidC/Oxa1 family membrane protein insertase
LDNQRNLILAVVLCGLLLFGWQFVIDQFYPQPAETEATQATADQPAVTRTREGGLTDPGEIAEEAKDLATALATADRVPIDAPDIAGSINPVGARIDDVSLKDHRQTVEKDSGPVRLFSPAGTPAQQYAQFGWAGEGVKLPDARTAWTAQGEKLTPKTPVTLTWDNGAGQVFTIRFTIDEKYLITAEQTVANTSAGPIVVRPYAVLNRTSRTASQDTWNVHAGPIGAFDGAVDFDWDYDDVAEAKTVEMAGRPNWIGFTDIYWLSALVAPNGSNPDASFRSRGNDTFRADLIYQPLTLAQGKQITRTTRLFVGAKESQVLADYERAGITNFSRTIDWGWFEILEKPILWLLKQLFALVGNFGIAIMLLTVIIRGLMFPIAQRQFASMATMRALQPKMKALQERYKDDKLKQQQETAALFKAEGYNPLAGCLPLLLQIPIFFALYKVLLLSIEMRHQPFALWLRDLSVPDPAHLLNLFGLLPFDPPGFLAIGPLALLLGITMFLQFKLNPAQMDPVQQQMFMIMPWVMMFIMAPFAAGLLLYWCTSNVLTIAQQAYLYSRHPQLKAQADKDKVDRERAAAREQK